MKRKSFMYSGFRTRLAGRILFAVAASSLGACAGSETGNGGRDDRPEEIWFRLVDGSTVVAPGPLETVDAGGTLFVVDLATARASEVRVEFGVGDCRSENGWSCNVERTAVKQEGAWLVDFLAGTVTPAIQVPVGLDLANVREVRVKWASVEEPTIEIGGSLVLPGESDKRPFGLTLDIEGLSRFVPPVPGNGGADGVVGDDWVLGLDPTRWFEVVDIAGCVQAGRIPVDAGGVLRLESAEGQCRAVVQGIATGFRMDGIAITEPPRSGP